MRSKIKPDFHLPTQMFINPGMTGNIGEILSDLGSRAIIISTTSDLEKLERTIGQISSNLASHNIGCLIYDEIPAIPNNEFIDSAVYFTKKTNCDMVIGIGGIESINAAKAVSLLTQNYVFCEEIFTMEEEPEPPLPLICIPSHPLYGFEILPIFFIKDIHDNINKVYQNNLLYPHYSLFDTQIPSPAYEHDIGSICMSALALSAESLISQDINEFTNTYALKSIDLIFKNVVKAFKDPHNIQVRNPLMTSSILSGIAFTTSYLSASLAMGLAISSRTNISLAVAMSVLIPQIMEYNLTASPGRYVQMAKVMDEDVREITVIEAAIKAIEAVRKLSLEVDIPQRLSQLGIAKSEFSAIANIAMEYSFIKNSPRNFNQDEIETILNSAF